MAIRKPKVARKDAPREVDLPEAGYKRADVLAEREDILQQQAEELAESEGRMAVDPSALEIDPDIFGHLDSLHVTGAQKGYHYCWVYTGQNGLGVTRKRAIGYELVKGNDPESTELSDAASGGLRRLGDTVLMRITQARYALIEAKEREKLEMRERGPQAGFEDMVARADSSIRGLSFEDMDPQTQKRLQAVAMAQAKLEGDLRDGTVPGLEINKG